MVTTRHEHARKPSATKTKQPIKRPPMPPKGFQKCLKRIGCPKEHGHASTCLDGFGLKGSGINNSAKAKTPLGWEFVVLKRDLAAEREAFPGWKPADSKKWDKGSVFRSSAGWWKFQSMFLVRG